MPEKIYVTYNYLPKDRARAQQMFLEAGMLDVVVDPALFDDPDVDLGDDPQSDQLQERSLAARGSETVPWTQREAVVLAYAEAPDPDSRFQQLASPFPADEDDVDALPRVTVPQDC